MRRIVKIYANVIMKGRPRIALALPDSKPWGLTRFLNGVNDYAREQGNWITIACPISTHNPNDFPLDLKGLKHWKGNGIILQSDDKKLLGTLLASRIPFVNIDSDLPFNPQIPRVTQNDRQIGRLAAKHLIERGLKNLAFHGVRGRWYCDERLAGFKQAASESGIKVNHFSLSHIHRDALWNERFQPLKKWLQSLPLPSGVFASHDYRGLMILDACQDIGLRVPDDVAVISSDNDVSVCEYCTPTLSSVCINAYRMGYESAALLDRLMHRATPPKDPILIEPGEVMARESTNVLHIADPIVKKAIDYMELHFKDSFKMDAVADEAAASRRLLEMRFREEMKSSPAEYLAALRVKKAKAMLVSAARQPLEEVARSCGFGTGKNLRAAFRRILGISPADVKANTP